MTSFLFAALFHAAASGVRAQTPPSDQAPPSYEEVLANPDDVKLNYRYALGQINRGQLRGASATLERVLMVDPDQTPSRLLHALVLVRLDNLTDAQREFAVLKAMTLPADMRATVDEYDRQLARQSKTTKVAGRLALGFEGDSNRNAGPSTGKALFLDQKLDLSGGSLRRSDSSMLGMAGFDLRQQLPGGGGHEAFAGYSYFRQDQRVQSSLDLQAHSVYAGLGINAMGFRFTPNGSFDNISLDRETLLVTEGGGLKVSRRLSSRIEGSVNFQGQYQDFRQTAAAGPMDERRGPMWDAGLGAQYEVTPTVRLNLTFDGVVKRAAKDYNGYQRYTAGFGQTWLIGRGFFMDGLVQAFWDRYDHADVAVSATKRSDDIYRARVSIGAPLASSGMLSGLVATVAVDYYHAHSNLPNYSYDNGKVMGMLNYRWEAYR
ncbi:MAG: hypothetical protein NTX64_09560 [Elusimicrobia bacterium]|nr:hypothetical protein [Elusimicrobiota bacterium]